jgi:7-methyl-GTP pyrophosphatase
MSSLPIILASTSGYRRALLDALGLEYTALPPRFEEDHTIELSPDDLVVEFARRKAESLLPDHPGALIVGADQVAEIDGQILTKPGTEARAVAQLLLLSGRTHRLLTATALAGLPGGVTAHRLVVHEMKMRPLTRDQAEAYVARDRPLDCAGAYRIEATGPLLFESMAGADHTAIVGLAITSLADLLREAGVDVLGRVLQIM